MGCWYTCPNDVKKISLKYVQNRHWKHWAVQQNVAELCRDVWFAPANAFIEMERRMMEFGGVTRIAVAQTSEKWL